MDVENAASVRGRASKTALPTQHLRQRPERLDRQQVGDPALGVPLLPGQMAPGPRGSFDEADVAGALGRGLPDRVLPRSWLSGLPELQLRVRSADLTLAGDLPALRLSGDAALETARVAVDESFFTGAGDALQLDPAMRVLRGPDADLADATRLGRAQAGDETTLPRWLDLDLGVDLDRSAFLDASMPMRAYLGAVASGFASIQLVAQMDGELRAEGANGDLSLEGAVVPVRGTATVFGKPFDIAGGTIAFTGRDYANPILDLTAVHDAGAYGKIEVRIRGSASAPDPTFSSDAYPSTDDVLAILVLGRPLSEAQSNDALSLVSGLLQSQLSQAGAAAPLDLLELGLSGVRVGQRLGPDLFLAVELDVVADDVTDDRVAVFGDAPCTLRAGGGRDVARPCS